MPIKPRVTYININSFPAGYSSRVSPYQSNKFTKLENWWPSPNESGTIEVIPGFSALTSSNIGGSTASAVMGLYSAKKSDGVITRFVNYNTASGSALEVVSAVAEPNTVSKTGLTSNKRLHYVTYDDLVLFFNGTDTPFKSDLSSNTASAISNIGLTQPTLGSATSALGSSGNVKGVVKYFVSFVTSTTEGPLSNAFGEIDAGDGNQVSLSSIPTGGGGVTARRIYRTTQDALAPLYLTTIEDNVTTAITDNTKDSSLGAPPAKHGAPPASSYNFPVTHFNRVWAAANNRIYFTDREEPESWFTENNFPISLDDGDTIKGLVRDSEGIFVFKERHIYKLLVTDPQAELATLIEITPSDPSSYSLGTPSHSSLTAVENGVVFYSNYGFYMVTSGREIVYLSQDIEDELRTNINESSAAKITGVYYPEYKLLLMSVPTGANTDNDTTYGYVFPARAWFKITEGFKDFVMTENASGTPVLWGSHTDDDSHLHLLFDTATNTFNGTNISSEAILPITFSSGMSRLTRWLKFDTEFKTQASGSLIVGYRLDRSTSTTTASVSLVKANFSANKATMNIGQQARLLEVIYKTNADQSPAQIFGLTIARQGLGDHSV